jgi:two-component system NtrC family response regulator
LPDIDKNLPSYKAYREDTVAAAEKVYFEELLSRTEGNLKEACRLSGLGRTRLYTLLKKHGLNRKS